MQAESVTPRVHRVQAESVDLIGYAEPMLLMHSRRVIACTLGVDV